MRLGGAKVARASLTSRTWVQVLVAATASLGLTPGSTWDVFHPLQTMPGGFSHPFIS